MAQIFPEVMTINETSQYLRIPVSTLYKLAQDGKVPCQKVGRHWRFRRAAIDRWLEENPNQQSGHNPGRHSSQGDVIQ
jgi:excisionase family DNA binding protein